MSRALLLTLTLVLALCVPVLAGPPAAESAERDASGAQDIPGIPRSAGSVLVGSRHDAFDVAELPRGKWVASMLGFEKSLWLMGERKRVLYLAPSGKSSLDVMRDHVASLQGLGYHILYECAGFGQCGQSVQDFYCREETRNRIFGSRAAEAAFSLNVADPRICVAERNEGPRQSYVFVFTAQQEGAVQSDAGGRVAAFVQEMVSDNGQGQALAASSAAAAPAPVPAAAEASAPAPALAQAEVETPAQAPIQAQAQEAPPTPAPAAPEVPAEAKALPQTQAEAQAQAQAEAPAPAPAEAPTPAQAAALPQDMAPVPAPSQASAQVLAQILAQAPALTPARESASAPAAGQTPDQDQASAQAEAPDSKPAQASPVAPAPARPAAAAPVPAEAKNGLCKARDLERLLAEQGRVILTGVVFEFGRAEIKAESQLQLAEAARLLKSKPELKVFIVGHTDNLGRIDYNTSLSQRRAAAVAQALVQDFGVDEDQVGVKGLAGYAPLASNATEEGRARNRRVEMVERWEGE